MAIVADSCVIVGLYDRRDSTHALLKSVLEKERDQIVISAVSLGEIDYLLRTRVGNQALLQFLADIGDGAFRIEQILPEDLIRCHALVARFKDVDLGLSDAAVVATADRLGTNQILTMDVRDFRLMRTRSGKPFRLLPADSR